MPNTFAYIVLFGWPLVVLVLFRRLPVPAAIAWSIIGGYLFLPVRTGIDLPMVPVIDKDAVPSLAAAVMCLVVAAGATEATRRQTRAAAGSAGEAAIAPRRQRSADEAAPDEVPVFRRTFGTVLLQALVLLGCASIFLTVLTNDRPVVFGPVVIPGLRLYDAVSILANLLIALIPFFLAQRYLATPESHVTLLRVFCLAGLGYSLLALFEVRMSPQLSRNIYGFFPGQFMQQMRGGGFRPVVFTNHGLWLGIFTAMAMLGMAAMWRQATATGRARAARWGLATAWMLGVLVLSNSAGALVVGLALLPAALLMGVRGQLMLAAVLAGGVLLYPMLRSAGLVPIETAISTMAQVSPDRAESFAFRVRNEDILLARANEKPLAGWGSWGRNRIYNDATGTKASVTDGMWVITIGTSGWLGYISQFGLLTLPIFFLAYARRQLDLSYATAGLALMLTANLIDMIPNATLTPLSWLIGGALVGRVAVAARASPEAAGPLRAARQPRRTASALPARNPPERDPPRDPPKRRAPRAFPVR